MNVDTEQSELLGVLERNLPGLAHALRFEWFYQNNPLGPAWSWALWESGALGAVGVASVFRRAM